jgi:hypothetical protein
VNYSTLPAAGGGEARMGSATPLIKTAL